MTDAYQVNVMDVFEGPMDLLVHLIRKNEVDIYDIPIGLITDQYLAYIDLMRSLNIDLAGDFLVMAATLTQIKSRMLLPVHAEVEEDDPRSEIAGPLMEYLEMKSAAEKLGDRDILGQTIFTRTPEKQKPLPDMEEEMVKVGLFELIDAFGRILEKVGADPHVVDMESERHSVKERINELIAILEVRGSVTFQELFEKDSSKPGVIVTFLAVLEMTKMCLLQIRQSLKTGAIRLFYV